MITFQPFSSISDLPTTLEFAKEASKSLKHKKSGKKAKMQYLLNSFTFQKAKKIERVVRDCLAYQEFLETKIDKIDKSLFELRNLFIDVVESEIEVKKEMGVSLPTTALISSSLEESQENIKNRLSDYIHILIKAKDDCTHEYQQSQSTIIFKQQSKPLSKREIKVVIEGLQIHQKILLHSNKKSL